MERARFKTEDWVRVRFGAGTPWRRCWCVISPPDEKEYAKLQKELNKKKSAYDRSRPPVLKGDVKFYDTKKITKKTRPIATLADAYCAFAIYPQSKPLIDASTLIKVEGTITIHSDPPTSTEGFVFVMPETHPAVSGFEIMLRWLFPALDTFALYGRPGRLIAETTNPQSLMFAMPTERRYGYLEILDVTGLILTEGSQTWREREWRHKMKELTAKRMVTMANTSRAGSRYSNGGSRRNTRNSFSAPRAQFNDGASVKSSSSIRWGGQPSKSELQLGGIPRTDSAPPGATKFQPPQKASNSGVSHRRSVSESHGLDRFPGQKQTESGFDGGYDVAPAPPPHTVGAPAPYPSALRHQPELSPSPERMSFEDERIPGTSTPVRELQDMQIATKPEPVAMPPAFSHAAGTLPPTKPYHSPELRRGKSRLSNTTLSQMAGAPMFNPEGERPTTSGSQRPQETERFSEDGSQRGVQSDVNASSTNANLNRLPEDLIAGRTNRLSFERSLPPAQDPSVHDVSSFPIPPTNPQYQPPVPIHQVHVPSKLIDNQHPNLAGPPIPVSTFHSHSASDSSTRGPPSISSQKGHGYTSSTDSARGLARLSTSSSQLKRKPLPQAQSTTDIDSPGVASSIGTPSNVIDQVAFSQIVPQHLQMPKNYDPHDSFLDLYHDNTSTASPDYASTQRSIDSQPSVDKPRAGVMRTVGTTAEEAPVSNLISSEIPQFDFGPTINYSRLPLDSSTQAKHGRNVGTPEPAQFPPRSSSRTNNTGAESSRQQLQSSGRNNVVSPEPQYRPDPNASRTVAWQPGMAVSGPVPQERQVITPEQFVQQRAAAAVPQYAHHKQNSSVALRSATPTSPGARNQTIDYSAHSRNNSSEILQRPNSRGPSAALAPAGSGDLSANLSAREQEQISRATGQPLLNMQGGRPAAPSGGLVGAIDAREQENKAMKQGLNSQVVEQAIMQRQQQGMAQSGGRPQGYPNPQFANQYPPRGQSPGPFLPQAQYPPRGQSPGPKSPQGQYPPRGQSPGPNMPQGQYSQYPPTQRQQAFVPPGGGVAAFSQGGGWSSPQRSPDQGQYFPPQGRGMGPPQGRGQPYPGPQGRGQQGPQGRGQYIQGPQGRGQLQQGPQGRGQPPQGRGAHNLRGQGY
jgi:CCR4-NOT transcriptional complex subunit CAF120